MGFRKRSPASSFGSLGGLIPGWQFAPLLRRISLLSTPSDALALRVRLVWMLAVTTLALFPAGLLSGAQTAPSSENGAYEIVVAKRRVGTEKFRITRGSSGWQATGELQLVPGAGTALSETATLQLDTNLRPSSYERQQKSPLTGSLTVVFGSMETSLVSVTPEGTNEQVFYLPENFLVVLDTNFFHHYSILLRLYDSSRGGAQPFNVFIPQESLPGMIHLELLGRETIPVGSATRELDHYKAITDEMQMDIWATPDKIIQRLWIPNADLEVLRQ